MTPDWMVRAACRGKPALFWFDREFYAYGKRICADCAVRSTCLAFAIDEGIWHGMWGGQSERERVRIRRKRKRMAA